MRIRDIEESFDSTHSKKPVNIGRNHYVLSSEIGGRKVEFSAHRIDGSEKEGTSVWNVSFSEGRGTYDKTGSGAQMQVFSFVIDCLKDLVIDHSPYKIEFSSSKGDGNRGDLYRKLITKFKGYHLESIQDGAIEELFTVTRNS